MEGTDTALSAAPQAVLSQSDLAALSFPYLPHHTSFAPLHPLIKCTQKSNDLLLFCCCCVVVCFFFFPHRVSKSQIPWFQNLMVYRITRRDPPKNRKPTLNSSLMLLTSILPLYISSKLKYQQKRKLPKNINTGYYFL